MQVENANALMRKDASRDVNCVTEKQFNGCRGQKIKAKSQKEWRQKKKEKTVNIRFLDGRK